MLDALAREADIVLLDTPPVLPVADTLVIGRFAAGAVLVVEAHATSTQAVQRAKDALIRNQTRLLGVVLNKHHATGDTYGSGPATPDPASGPWVQSRHSGDPAERFHVAIGRG